MLLLVATVVPAEETGPTAADTLTTLLGATRTMRASVEQLTLDQDGREVQEFRASLILSKPDHFYFHATEPYERLMLTDGVRLWNYEPDLEQVTIDPFNSDYSSTPAMLLSADSATLSEQFDILMTTQEGNITRFVLYPLQPDSLFIRLSLAFTGELLTELQFENSLGQQTSMSFSDIETNIDLPEDTFRFEIPEGTDVIDSTVD